MIVAIVIPWMIIITISISYVSWTARRKYEWAQYKNHLFHNLFLSREENLMPASSSEFFSLIN